MKLTTEMLKKMIMEELNEDPSQPAEESPLEPEGAQEKAGQASEKGAEQKKLNSLSKLGDEFIMTGKALKSAKVKGLDATEMNLVSQLMAINLELASSKSAGTILKRVLALMQKQV